jgi:hypothetical protein
MLIVPRSETEMEEKTQCAWSNVPEDEEPATHGWLRNISFTIGGNSYVDVLASINWANGRLKSALVNLGLASSQETFSSYETKEI